MKPNFLLLLSILQINFMTAQTIVEWSDSLIITSTSNAITSPKIFVKPDGNLMATWGTNGNPSQIWCAHWENGGFGSPVEVLKNPYNPSLFGFGGYDVAVYDSLVYVVFEQQQDGVSLAVSRDGGHTFDQPSNVQGAISGAYVTLASVVADGTGNPVVSYIVENNVAVYQVRRSTDFGASFLPPVTANTPAPGGAVCECCTSDLLASGDSIWMVYRNNNQNLRDIWVTRSSDLATSFTVATDVDATDWVLNSCPISGPKIAKSGDSLLLVWMSKANSSGRIYLSSLHGSTMQFGQQIDMPNLPGLLNAQSQPDVAAHYDTVGVAHVEKAREILFYHSVTGATDIKKHPQRFAVPNHSLQLPSLAFHNGFFHLVYVDQTADQILYRKGTIEKSSRVSESEKLIELSIFPNPAASETLQINSPVLKMEQLTVSDVSGKTLVVNHLNDHAANLKLPGLKPGIYFLQVKFSEGFSVWRRFQVQ
jgi:hypothetical protein